MMTKITPDQARQLAALVADFRRSSGIEPRWDEQGVYASIGKAQDRGTPLDIAAAAIAAAKETTNRTPAVIAMDGPHWASRARQGATAVPTAAQERCPVEGHERELAGHCRICAAEKYEPSEPTPLTSWTERDAAWARHLRNPERYPAPDIEIDRKSAAAGERGE